MFGGQLKPTNGVPSWKKNAPTPMESGMLSIKWVYRCFNTTSVSTALHIWFTNCSVGRKSIARERSMSRDRDAPVIERTRTRGESRERPKRAESRRRERAESKDRTRDRSEDRFVTDFLNFVNRSLGEISQCRSDVRNHAESRPLTGKRNDVTVTCQLTARSAAATDQRTVTDRARIAIEGNV